MREPGGPPSMHDRREQARPRGRPTPFSLRPTPFKLRLAPTQSGQAPRLCGREFPFRTVEDNLGIFPQNGWKLVRLGSKSQVNCKVTAVGFPSGQLPQWSVLVSFPSGRFPHPSGQFPGGQCRSEQCRSVSVGRCRSVSVSFGQFPQWSVSPVVSFPSGQFPQWSVSPVVSVGQCPEW